MDIEYFLKTMVEGVDGPIIIGEIQIGGGPLEMCHIFSASENAEFLQQVKDAINLTTGDPELKEATLYVFDRLAHDEGGKFISSIQAFNHLGALNDGTDPAIVMSAIEAEMDNSPDPNGMLMNDAQYMRAMDHSAAEFECKGR